MEPKTPQITKDALLKRIIKDDLINHRLVMGFHQLGLVSEIYFLHASQTVFDCLGIKEKPGEEFIYAKYEKMKDKVMELDLEKDMKKLDGMVEKIYKTLISQLGNAIMS